MRMALLSVENSSCLISSVLKFTSSSPIPDTRGFHFTHILQRIHLPAILSKKCKGTKKGSHWKGHRRHAWCVTSYVGRVRLLMGCLSNLSWRSHCTGFVATKIWSARQCCGKCSWPKAVTSTLCKAFRWGCICFIKWNKRWWSVWND